MPDVAKILKLVEQGVLSADEADQILASLGTDKHGPAEKTAGQGGKATGGSDDRDQPRHLRVEITEGGRRVVNLRVPLNLASVAAGFVPGLPDDAAERVRSAIRAGERGPIVDITTDDGDRVLIVNE
jgi:SHOCT-like protein